MILTYDQIKEAQEKGDITIDPFDERLLQGASYGSARRQTGCNAQE
jgi:type VI protein secretion system component VasA